MKILVTEAASTVAYHFINLLASGDVISGKRLDLVLCDRADNLPSLQGLRCELQDCVYPSLNGVSISSNFCDAIKAVDIAVLLPFGYHGKGEVSINFKTMHERNFSGLDAAFHHSDGLSQALTMLETRGPMSMALSIADWLRHNYMVEELKAAARQITLADAREEAQFGIPPLHEYFNGTITSNVLSHHEPSHGTGDSMRIHCRENHPGEEKLFEEFDQIDLNDGQNILQMYVCVHNNAMPDVEDVDCLSETIDATMTSHLSKL